MDIKSLLSISFDADILKSVTHIHVNICIVYVLIINKHSTHIYIYIMWIKTFILDAISDYSSDSTRNNKSNCNIVILINTLIN